MCGISDVRHRIIGQLSKGYRQRVGLADALLGEPDLLILDEPTIGLDPVQIRQVRQLIKDLGKQHTILLSTHILPEVEMTCNRVIIIHRGKVLISDTMANLIKSTLEVEVSGGLRVAVQAALRAVPGVDAVRMEPGDSERVHCVVYPKSEADPTEGIFDAVTRGGWKLRELSQSRTSLEDIFIQITREEDEAEEDRRDQRRSLLR
jgi:ABC-2 type transport system ATP-binding protein